MGDSEHGNKIRHYYDDYKGYYEEVVNYRVKFRDVFSMKHFYFMLHEWLVEEEWIYQTTPFIDALFPETFYLKREDQTMGVESFIHWRLKKYAFSKGPAKTWRGDMFVYFHLLHLKDIEVLHKGVKYKANSGEVEVKVRINLVAEKFAVWKDNAIMKHFINVLWKRFLYKDKERFRNQFYREGYRFQEAMKTFFKLVTFMPEPELQRFYYKRDFER